MPKSEAREAVHESNIIEYGSEGQKALLGLAAQMAPSMKADIEAQLGKVPTVMPAAQAKRKKPIVDPHNFQPRTSRSDGDTIMDGWVRVGGRR
jgi:hypothetical protein